MTAKAETPADLADRQARRIMRKLAAPFEPTEIKFRAGVTSKDKTKALAFAFIDARNVMDRLDSVVGCHNWQDSYLHLGDGTVLCTLSIRINGEWIAKQGVGAPSDQKEADNRAKAALSEALKLAAIKWGIGRFLYAMPKVWVAYDEQRQQLSEKPQIPAWALPSKMPMDGDELLARLLKAGIALARDGKCKQGELLAFVRGEGKKAGLSDNMADWDDTGISLAWDAAARFKIEMNKATTVANGTTTKT
jgi:hypothetical protein